MKVRMQTLSAGPGGIRHAGQVYDLPKPEAEALIAGNFAVADSAPSAESPRAAVEGQPANPASKVYRVVKAFKFEGKDYKKGTVIQLTTAQAEALKRKVAE